MKDILTKNIKYIYKALSEEEIDNLKIDYKKNKIIIKHNDYNNIIFLINKLNKECNIIIYLEDRDKLEFNKILENNYEAFSNVKIRIVKDIEKVNYDIKTYCKHEKYLTSLIEPAMDLSPFEKYLYAYNIVKKYKKFKENYVNATESRDLYKILYNDYIVCVGFSRLLVDLLYKLGIESEEIGAIVNIGFDGVENNFELPESVITEQDKHSRVRVKLIDSKYNIDGIFIADPTWDNHLEKDSYAYALMNAFEYDNIRRENYLDNDNIVELLFTSYTIEEFYQRVNYIIDFLLKNIDTDNSEIDAYEVIINNIMRSIYNIDIKYYNKYKEILDMWDRLNRYKCIIESMNQYGFSDENVSKKLFKLKMRYAKAFNYFIENIGKYIVSKVNNIVPGETFKKGIRKLYTEFYGISSKEVEERLEETLEYNKDRYNRVFPNRKEMLKDGTIVDHITIKNKFKIKRKRVA